MLFSVATARMHYGCDYRLKRIHMNAPGILTNGVFLYDFWKGTYLSVEEMDWKAVEKVVSVFEECGLSCFVYVYEDEKISIYYDDENLEKQTQYFSKRALESCREVKRIENYEEILWKGKACYIAYTGEKQKLASVCVRLDEIEGIDYSFYLNIYNGLCCLEIFSSKANKQNALLKLKKLLSCEEVVVFGDNLNDLPMIEIADRSYAPENALKEVKGKVNGILADCAHDGVAHFLLKEV